MGHIIAADAGRTVNASLLAREVLRFAMRANPEADRFSNERVPNGTYASVK